MSKQTKYFIEASDIVAVRFECQNCHATVSMVVNKDMKFESLGSCLNCNEPWMMLGGSNITLPVKECVKAIEKMSAVLNGWKENMKTANQHGFSFSLEVLEPVISD